MVQQPGAASIPLRSIANKKTTRDLLASVHFRWAVFGIMAVGILIPCVLTWLHAHGDLFPAVFLEVNENRMPWNLFDLMFLLFIALIGCGPGAFLLGLFAFTTMRRARCLKASRENEAMRHGALLGAALAFANFPGYLSAVFYEGEDLIALRIALLFVVTGATCGAWIAWQAYRERHPERGLFPRFSLRTLIVGAFSWGLLLAVYMPQ